jgi:hypothetical protein
MPFTGKATYNAGSDLPELMEDVSDLISLVSPYETPLLDHLGDAKRAAGSTIHEWLEDELLPNTDTLNQTTFSPNATDATSLTVANGSRFQVGDQVRPGNSGEIMFVTAVSTNTLTVVRGYGATTKVALTNGIVLTILGNAALEGDDMPNVRFTNRTRKRNYTQIFTAGIQVSGSMLAAKGYGVSDEVEYQKQERLRELLRDLENCVINGIAPASTAQGGTSTRRTMSGIVRQISTNQFTPGSGSIPVGGGTGQTDLSEDVLNAALRAIWEKSSARVDTIIVGGAQKRRINSFVGQKRSYVPEDSSFREMVNVYESDYGVARVILSRWVASDSVILVDSSRVEVLPLQGRSFFYKPLAATGDRESGQVVGEYTLEFRNEAAHGVIRGLST